MTERREKITSKQFSVCVFSIKFDLRRFNKKKLYEKKCALVPLVKLETYPSILCECVVYLIAILYFTKGVDKHSASKSDSLLTVVSSRTSFPIVMLTGIFTRET